MNSKYLFLILLVIFNNGCSEYKDRKLLFSCNGNRYLYLTDESFNTRDNEPKIPSKTSLFVGEKTTEVFGMKKEICENGHTLIVFGNCEKNDLTNYYTFDIVTHKLFIYDYYSEDYRKKKNFPSVGESLRGEFQCELVENSK
jgi:hypothetical protein